MYEVGSWFIWMIDGAILALLGIVAMIAIFVKRGKYQKEARDSIRAEILLPTGWSEFHVVPCDDNAKSVTVGRGDPGKKENFIYLLDPNFRRYGKHPLNPFMGLPWLQVPIRIETWYLDNPEPMRKSYEKVVATSMEIKAITREIQATTAAMQIQEIDARQKELVNAIANQPSKMVVYIGLGAAVLFSLIGLIIVAQLGGVMG